MTIQLRIHEVEAAIKLSRAMIYRQISAGCFPAPIKIGRSSRWRSDDVDAWIEALSTGSDTEDNSAP
jgi:prophage regulatory protein